MKNSPRPWSLTIGSPSTAPRVGFEPMRRCGHLLDKRAMEKDPIKQFQGFQAVQMPMQALFSVVLMGISRVSFGRFMSGLGN